ncbi:MAG: NAD(P)H-hydrate dehydratase [Pseudomonadaceae bacterium]|nr:NAD(P)H-hydrate dehydratase [Pseudomonadaceae bacterium]
MYTSAESRLLDQRASATLGIPTYELMRRAGRAAFDALSERWPEASALLVCCGKGNNAGDGYVVAQLAKQAGFAVRVWQLGRADTMQGDALRAQEAALAANVPVIAGDDPDLVNWQCDVIVDALLGTGLAGELRDAYRAAVDAMNAASAPKFALDLPTGVLADSGGIAGAAVTAAVTIAFLGVKRGCVTGPGVASVGELLIDDLGYVDTDEELGVAYQRFTQNRLPRRAKRDYKGDAGHVLIVGGDTSMAGAATLASESALRCGAGLVTALTRAEHRMGLQVRRPEVMVTDDPAHGLARADVVALGPGLGRRAWGRQLFEYVLAADLPSVIDADGLYWLADLASRYGAPSHSAPWLLTPHVGEAARLLATAAADIEADRFGAAHELAQRFNAQVVIKGPGSVMAGPDGQLSVCAHGNPGMASGGMGDVLCGVAAAMLGSASGDAFDQLVTAVTLHSAAADSASTRTGELGLLASDVVDELALLTRRPATESAL